jgi:NADPH:quinone reductase-like Zn-dependent oxidoreductase
MIPKEIVIRSKYGSPDVLRLENVPLPTPKNNEVLIKVHATTVNRTDCANLWGKPWIMKIILGFSKPKLPIPGTDFAGVIEKIGSEVTLFQVGDKVWGFNDLGSQSHAEYLTLPENSGIAAIPDNYTFEEAASCAEGAHYAYNIINKVSLQAGQKVLVNGASGAIGSALVQMVKYLGLHVTAVCPTKAKEAVRLLGADKIIDYTVEDFTKDAERYDYVFDAVGKSTFAACKPLLLPKGIYISSELGPKVQNPFLALVTPLFGGKKVVFPVPSNINASLGFTKSLMEQGKFKPLMDKQYPLESIAEAYNYVVSGQKIGNVIVTIS